MNHRIWLSSPHMGGGEQQFVNEASATNRLAPLGLLRKDFRGIGSSVCLDTQ
ncbi:MAG TPA: hypothetical protein VLH61_11805 [Bacteroidales bacterium]|nr:hypothetical protein [Bacteroidales bacterium]